MMRSFVTEVRREGRGEVVQEKKEKASVGCQGAGAAAPLTHAAAPAAYIANKLVQKVGAAAPIIHVAAPQHCCFIFHFFSGVATPLSGVASTIWVFKGKTRFLLFYLVISELLLWRLDWGFI